MRRRTGLLPSSFAFVSGRYDQRRGHGFPDTRSVTVSTELRMVGDRAQFRVETDDPAYRRALAELAFEEGPDGAFVRGFPAEAGRLHESYLRFKLTLGDVLDQAVGRK